MDIKLRSLVEMDLILAGGEKDDLLKRLQALALEDQKELAELFEARPELIAEFYKLLWEKERALNKGDEKLLGEILEREKQWLKRDL